jgi:hypothetical protein
MSSTLNSLLAKVDKLPVEQQETLVEVVRHRLIEERRKQIAKNAQTTLDVFHSGKAKSGTVNDLRRALRK